MKAPQPRAYAVAVRKIVVTVLVIEHMLLLLYFVNALPGLRLKPPNRERVECEGWGHHFGWNVMTHRWECHDNWAVWGIPGV